MVSRRKIGSVKLPKVKSKSNKPKRAPIDVMFEKFIKDPNNNPEVYNNAEDPIIADAKFNIKVLEEEADQATADYLQDIDDVFDPAKRKALAEKLDLTQDQLVEQLRIISARNENQRLVDEEPCHLASENNPSINSDVKKFHAESMEEYSAGLDQSLEDALENQLPDNLNLADLDVTTEGSLDLGKLADRLAEIPEGIQKYQRKTKLTNKAFGTSIPPTNKDKVIDWFDLDGKSTNRNRGGYIGRTPADDEQERHNKAMEAKQDRHFKRMEEIALEANKPQVNNWVQPLTAEKEGLETLKKELDQAKEEEDFTGKPATYICRKLVCKSAFKKYAQKHLEKGSTVNDAQVGEAFKKSDAYKDIEGLIEWAMEEDVYQKMPLEKRAKAWKAWYKDRKGKQPYKLQMPSDSKWILIREDVYKDKDLRTKKRSRGRP